jgi:hypothetical protein
MFFDTQTLIGNYYTESVESTLLILQDFYNLGLRFSDSDIQGTTCFIEDDDIREYVVINPIRNLDILATLNCDYSNIEGTFTLFSNYEYYIEQITQKVKLNSNKQNTNLMDQTDFCSRLSKWGPVIEKI